MPHFKIADEAFKRPSIHSPLTALLNFVTSSTPEGGLDLPIISSLLKRLDSKYFQEQLLERGGIKSCYKRIYLQLMTFTLEVLNEDWSEIAPPDFDAIVSTVSNSERQRFAYILLLVCWKGDKQLKHEIEGLLAIFDKEQREKVLENLLLIGRFIHSVKEHYPPVTRVTPTKKELINEETSIVVETIPMVPEADYRALQILYEAISFEADKLRAELIHTRQLISEFQSESTKLKNDAAHMLTELRDQEYLIEDLLNKQKAQQTLDDLQSLSDAKEQLENLKRQASLWFPKVSWDTGAMSSLFQTLRDTIQELEDQNLEKEFIIKGHQIEHEENQHNLHEITLLAQVRLQELTLLKEECQAWKQQYIEAGKKHAFEQSEQAARVKELEQQQESQLCKLYERCTNLEEQVRSNEATIADLKLQLATKIENINELLRVSKEEFGKQEQDYRFLKEQFEVERSKLKDAINLRKRSLHELGQKLKSARSEIAKFHNENASLHLYNRRIGRQLKHKWHCLYTARKAHEECTNQLNENTKEWIKLRDGFEMTIDMLSNDVGLLELQLTQQYQEKMTLKEELDTLRFQVINKEDFGEDREEIKRLEKELAQRYLEIRKFGSEKVLLHNQLAASNNQAQDLARRLANLEIAHNTLQTSHQRELLFRRNILNQFKQFKALIKQHIQKLKDTKELVLFKERKSVMFEVDKSIPPHIHSSISKFLGNEAKFIKRLAMTSSQLCDMMKEVKSLAQSLPLQLGAHITHWDTKRNRVIKPLESWLMNRNKLTWIANVETEDNYVSEAEKIREQARQMVENMKKEHAAILDAWHDLGARIYRNTFYQTGMDSFNSSFSSND